MSSRFEMVMFHLYNDEEKAAWWMKEFNKPYGNVCVLQRHRMIQVSIYVKDYINANEQDKEKLWHQYDFLTKCYCDPERWNDELQKERQIKKYAYKLLPKS